MVVVCKSSAVHKCVAFFWEQFGPSSTLPTVWSCNLLCSKEREEETDVRRFSPIYKGVACQSMTRPGVWAWMTLMVHVLQFGGALCDEQLHRTKSAHHY